MSQSSTIRNLWFKWKSLRLPWRRKRLVGHDLYGVTFWELRNDNRPSRPRRVAEYPQQTHHSDVILDPAWIQWLRHTRPLGPSIQEQLLEVQRQEQLKQLAAAADQRWAEKPSYLDAPQETRQLPPDVVQPRDKGGYAGADGRPMSDAVEGVKSVAAEEQKGPGKGGKEKGQDVSQSESLGRKPTKPEGEKENPWAKPAGGPSEEWQPQAWSPASSERR